MKDCTLYEGTEIREDKIVRDDNNKPIVFPSENAAKTHANRLGLSPYLIVAISE